MLFTVVHDIFDVQGKQNRLMCLQCVNNVKVITIKIQLHSTNKLNTEIINKVS